MDKKLIKAVTKQLEGEESFQDIYTSGIGGGFTGFIYYLDTIEFFRKNKTMIVKLAEDTANELYEEGVLSMIKAFNCLKDDDLTLSQIGKVLYSKFSNTNDNTMIMNALSWFAAEEVARYVIENKENKDN